MQSYKEWKDEPSAKLFFHCPNTSISKLVVDVFNKFKVDKKEMERMATWRDKARYINGGLCAEFAYRVLKAMKKKSEKNNEIKEALRNTHVVVLQYVHCFLIVNNTIYDAECLYGIPVTNRTVIDKFAGKWLIGLNGSDKYIEQYKVVDYSDDSRKLEKTGYTAFKVPEDVTQEEQEEVWIPVDVFVEAYEANDGTFDECSYIPD